jgi:hypothetical protein
MGAYADAADDVRNKVDALLDETRDAGGLAPVDLEAFWADNAKAQANPFGRDIPQCAFGAILTWECVFDELGIDEDYYRFHTDEAWALDVSRRYNDLSEKIVGRRLLNEKPRDPASPGPISKVSMNSSRPAMNGKAAPRAPGGCTNRPIHRRNCPACWTAWRLGSETCGSFCCPTTGRPRRPG